MHCRVPIPMATAALGGAIEVPTIDGGRAKVRCRPAPRPASSSACKGKGMSVLRTAARGDMYVEIVVETPVNLTKAQQELLQEFEDEGKKGASHSPNPTASSSA